ncbi:MAG: flagellin [Selenomonadaceae bacterium]|nr:flagellin [Selenomonadaceae bacterium]
MPMTIHGPYARGADGLTTIYNTNQNAMAKSIEKVSTGQKINHAGDDPAAKAISDKMLAQIRSLDQGEQNTQNANAFLKIADASISSMVDIITSMREKAIQASSDYLSAEDRNAIQLEIDQLAAQVDSAALVKYNGRTLLNGDFGTIQEAVRYDADTNKFTNADGTAIVDENGDEVNRDLQFTDMTWKNDGNSVYFQTGPDKDDGILTHLMDMTKEALFKDVNLDVSTIEKSQDTIKGLDSALTRALFQQTVIGSVQQRLDYTATNLQETTANTQDALSTIKDADMAREMTNYVKHNMLLQATQAMMANANTTLSSFIDLIKQG